MNLLHPVTEDEMVAVFLQSEIFSERFGQNLAENLEKQGQDPALVMTPDLSNEADNAARRRVMGDFRGYRQNRELFEDFPDEIAWHRALLEREEVAQVKYIDYSYWNEISGGSRLPADATRTIRAGREIYGQSTEGFLRAAHALETGARFPELILVGASPESDLIVLEGHVRLTAYLLAPDFIPDPLQVIIGFAPEFASW
jgi:hypothetical protein